MPMLTSLIAMSTGLTTIGESQVRVAPKPTQQAPMRYLNYPCMAGQPLFGVLKGNPVLVTWPCYSILFAGPLYAAVGSGHHTLSCCVSCGISVSSYAYTTALPASHHTCSLSTDKEARQIKSIATPCSVAHRLRNIQSWCRSSMSRKSTSRRSLGHGTDPTRGAKATAQSAGNTARQHKENLTPAHARQSFVKSRKQVFADFGVQVFAPLPRAISPERELPKPATPAEVNCGSYMYTSTFVHMCVFVCTCVNMCARCFMQYT